MHDKCTHSQGLPPYDDIATISQDYSRLSKMMTTQNISHILACHVWPCKQIWGWKNPIILQRVIWMLESGKSFIHCCSPVRPCWNHSALTTLFKVYIWFQPIISVYKQVPIFPMDGVVWRSMVSKVALANAMAFVLDLIISMMTDDRWSDGRQVGLLCQGRPQLASPLTMTKGFEVLDGVKADLSI